MQSLKTFKQVTIYYLHRKKVLLIQNLFIFIDIQPAWRNKMTKEKKEGMIAAAWLNLFIGFYNMYLWGVGDWWFNLVIGTLNIGVWVFFRKI